MEKLKIYIKWSAGLLAVFLFGTLFYGALQQDDRQALSVSAELEKTIVIDAGHGGEDGGASANGLLEKDINLDIALRLRDMLSAAGCKVIMTRDSDVSLGSGKTVRERKVDDLKKRADIINSDGSELLVSIHQNKFGQSKYSGTQIFCSRSSPESLVIGESIRRSVTGLLQPDNKRELKTDDGSVYILSHANIPAVIVECGFLSNEAEAEKLADEEYRSNMAFAIMCGILEYESEKQGK